jgi:hypothetical protein
VIDSSTFLPAERRDCYSHWIKHRFYKQVITIANYDSPTNQLRLRVCNGTSLKILKTLVTVAFGHSYDPGRDSMALYILDRTTNRPESLPMASTWVVPSSDKAFILYYLVFHECPEEEFTACNFITITCFKNMVTQSLPFAHPLIANETVATLITRLRQDRRLPDGEVRVYQVIGYSRLEEFGDDHPIVVSRGANVHFKVDVIPPEYLNIDPNALRLVQVNRIQIRGSATPQPWETPFFFPVYRDEPFPLFRERLGPLLRFPEGAGTEFVFKYAGNNQESKFTNEDIPFDILELGMVIQVYQLWELKIKRLGGTSLEDIRKARERPFSLGGEY